MIEKMNPSSRMQLARRKGVAPSTSLRPHFLSLARQVLHWSEDHLQPPVSIGVTSLSTRAGRSTISFNLASALSSIRRNQVILVESDFGKPFVSRRLGNFRSPGLAEMLAGTSSESSPIIQTPVPDLFLLGCGQASARESLELPFELLPGLIQEQLAEFEFAIFDLPLASDLTCCSLVAPKLDGVILTLESGNIDQRRIARFKKQMELLNVKVVGVVMNKS